jgi:single-strand DNA-binding protein
MARGLNKVMLIGHLGADPDVRYTPGKTAVASFNLATNESYKDSSGAMVDRTEWHRIVAWDKLAEICGNYLKKGTLVYIEGSLQTRSWEDKEGQKKFTTEIKARDMQILTPKDGGSGGGFASEPSYKSSNAGSSSSQSASPSYTKDKDPFDPGNDDLPF